MLTGEQDGRKLARRSKIADCTGRVRVIVILPRIPSLAVSTSDSVAGGARPGQIVQPLLPRLVGLGEVVARIGDGKRAISLNRDFDPLPIGAAFHVGDVVR